MKVSYFVLYQKISLRDGEQQFNKSVESIVQGFISIEPGTIIHEFSNPVEQYQPKDSKINIRSTQCCFKHGEADGNSLQLERVHLIFGNNHIQNTISWGQNFIKPD